MSYQANLPPLNCRLQMQLVRLFADHKSFSIRQGDIVFRVPHPHVFCLEVAIHHKASHEKVFTETKCRQLPGSKFLSTHLFSYPLQSSGRLIPGCAHKAQNIAIEPGFASSFSSYPKPNRFRVTRALHILLTLSSSRYRSYLHRSIHNRQMCWPDPPAQHLEIHRLLVSSGG